LQGIFTVSRNDFYDYLRCPKIISLRIHRNLTRPPPPPRLTPKRNIPYEIGTIGEVATREILSESGEEFLEDEGEIGEEGEIEESEIFPRMIEINLEKKGVQLDQQMRDILKDSLEGLKSIKKYLTDEYGDITILGRAESRSGIMPGKIRPDFVAMSSEMKKPILIEVKNTAKLNSKPDNFQASFYNSISQNNGVLILEERLDSGKNSIIPKLYQDVLPETLLVYPRLATFQVVSDTVKITQNIINEIWQAKQLGLIGKTPHTDCNSKCPHHKLGDLPEGNIEPAIPLPLVYAQGLREQGRDLDLDYLRKFLFKNPVGSEFFSTLGDFKSTDYQLDYFKYQDSAKAETKRKELESNKEKYLDLFSEKTGLSRKTVETLSSRRKNIWSNDKKILKEMANEIYPWEKIIGEKKFKNMHSSIKGFTTKIYSIPDKSDYFIKRAWENWK